MSGKVILVGAGPGDPGLLTVKGRKALESAEVVVYDRLVSPAVLAMIPEGAEAVDVGKRAARHTVPQGEINQILLRKAREGKLVVRLKGGDPFVFGRGGEELEALAEQGIDFEVIPGVTSAVAAPAYAGIPVTHRDCCSSLHIVTGHRREGTALDIRFRALVQG
ncbi:MAG: uroporphyrinogen-III C-methyltransferase, partial [Oscillospiraceae bacterium]|nr:uroporphyrinogen-III C-methyltransferase [Oscillospiraceae bacterium]